MRKWIAPSAGNPKSERDAVGRRSFKWKCWRLSFSFDVLMVRVTLIFFPIQCLSLFLFLSFRRGHPECHSFPATRSWRRAHRGRRGDDTTNSAGDVVHSDNSQRPLLAHISQGRSLPAGHQSLLVHLLSCRLWTQLSSLSRRTAADRTSAPCQSTRDYPSRDCV